MWINLPTLPFLSIPDIFFMVVAEPASFPPWRINLKKLFTFSKSFTRLIVSVAKKLRSKIKTTMCEMRSRYWDQLIPFPTLHSFHPFHWSPQPWCFNEFEIINLSQVTITKLLTLSLRYGFNLTWHLSGLQVQLSWLEHFQSSLPTLSRDISKFGLGISPVFLFAITGILDPFPTLICTR